MIPVNPPAANAKRSTAGNQKRRKMCLRSPGGAATIAPGVYDFKRLNGGLAAIITPAFLLSKCFKMPVSGNVDSHSRTFSSRDYSLSMHPSSMCQAGKQVENV